MARFFIDRPIFAWVIAIVIMLAGALAITNLPIAQYPSIAPPAIAINASYPGASAKTAEDSVTQVIEQKLTGIDGLLYISSTTDSFGNVTLTLTFDADTDPDIAQVQTQNKVQQALPLLPQAVQNQGVTVAKSARNFLMVAGFVSEDGRLDGVDLADFLVSTVQDAISRVDGVGEVTVFGSQYAMRIWLDPDKLNKYQLTTGDVTAAVAAQNTQVSAGQLGGAPALPGQGFSATVTAQSRLQTVSQFEDILLRSARNGGEVRLRDVARIEIGAQSYETVARFNGQPAAGMGIRLASGANALATADRIRAKLDDMAPYFPAGVKYVIPYDTTPFVRISIEEVVKTLIEAVILVFLVMYLFLQNFRATLIPTIAVPVVLLGTFAVMQAFGFSINTLTMFGMVLAIGIIVDDAIVVVENVERLMATQGLSPKEATSRAMQEITGAVIGITLVLTAVFIPMAFGSGSVGVIYQQFTLSMAVSILFSAFLALSLTPALCATLLRPVSANHHEKSGFFGAFNRGFERLTASYGARVARLVGRSGRMMAAFAVLCAVLAVTATQLPSSFLPEEDQGYFMTSIQLPTGATSERTLDVVKAYEAHVASRPGLDANMVVLGFSFAGSGPNAAMAFTMLKDWDQRDGATAAEEAALAQQAMADSVEGTVMSLMPPAIDELGTSSGFTMILQDRANRGEAALQAAQAQLLELAAQSSVVSDVYPDGLPPGESIRLEIDRQKAEAMGLSFAVVSSTLSAAMGSLYVNDFPNAGRLQQVILQADAPARMQLDDVLGLRVRNAGGGMVPLREVVTPVWSESPQQMLRYQGFPAVRISGGAASGVSSGAAMAEMERLVAQLPKGYAAAWTGASLQERQSAAQAPLLMLLSALVVFLVLAALYESWSIPLSVMLVVPLGLLGAVAAVMLRGMPNDVFFKVGMITIIGLSAKNAILIVEFARQLHAEGRTLIDAAVTAARLRLRPILMTSLAFTLGVVPLMIASGASAETQHAIGTGVFGGMLSGTVLAVFFVPVFFVFVIGTQERLSAWRAQRGTTVSPQETP